MNRILKYIAATFIVALVSTQAYSQNIGDALRYSMSSPQATARVAGVGGSFGAMGGDIGIMTINPAGLAGFVRSEFSFTPTLTSTNTDAFFVSDQANVLNRSQTNFGFSNVSAIFASRPRSGSWETSNFSISYLKTADLNRGFTYNGTTMGSYSESQDIPEDLFGIEFADVELDKEQVVSQKGYISELSLAWAGNYNNQIDIGVSLGIPFVSFEEEKSYSEVDAGNTVGVFNQYDRTDYLSTSGAGINFKAGFIYKGVKPIRIGASIHSPNYYVLTDDFGFSDQYTFDDQGTDALESDNSFKYKLKSPWKVNGSLGVLYNLGKIKGFANADIEFLDYSSANFDLGAYSAEIADVQYGEIVNSDIDTELTSALNIRLGTELAYDKLRLRLGTGLVQSPYEIDEGDYTPSYAFGLGLREDNFYIDFAYTRDRSEEGYLPYVPDSNVDDDPLVNVETIKSRMQLTAGFKF